MFNWRNRFSSVYRKFASVCCPFSVSDLTFSQDNWSGISHSTPPPTSFLTKRDNVLFVRYSGYYHFCRKLINITLFFPDSELGLGMQEEIWHIKSNVRDHDIFIIIQYDGRHSFESLVRWFANTLAWITQIYITEYSIGYIPSQ